MPAYPQMLHAFDFLRGRQVRMRTRDLHHLVSEPDEFLSKREPNFLDRAAHDRRDGKKRAQDDRDFHVVRVSPCSTGSNESTARCISKRFAKHSRALVAISLRFGGGVASQRSIRRCVPATPSSSAKPQASSTISRQILILFEIRTGVPQASASPT